MEKVFYGKHDLGFLFASLIFVVLRSPYRMFMRAGRRAMVYQFTLVYGVIAGIELLSEFMEESFPWLHYVSKPLLLLSLLIFYGVHSYRRRDLLDYCMYVALAASWLGDLLLMGREGLFFLGGLLAFLLAHLAYTLAFILSHKIYQEDALLRRKPWLVLLFAAYGVLLLSLVGGGLGEMALPVVIYAFAILGMVLSAINRWKRVPEDSFAPVFLGALLFMISDSLIALDRFGSDLLPLPWAGFWIMLT
jgi:uncharacterized membrane protein YhhN